MSVSASVASMKNSDQKRNVCFSFSTGLIVAAQRLISLMFSIVDFKNLHISPFRGETPSYQTGGFNMAIFRAASQAFWKFSARTETSK